LILIGRLEAERQPRRPHHASSQTGHRTRRPAAEGYRAKCALPASKSESQQQSEHEHDQQCCRDRDDAVSGKMQSPEADLKSIAHSMALHLKKLRALGGQSICPPICWSVNREYAAMFLNREHGGCSNGLMPRSNRRCYRSAVSVVRQMAGCVVHS